MSNLDLARDPDTSSDILAKLASDNDVWQIRKEVAQNPKTSSKTLAKLAV